MKVGDCKFGGVSKVGVCSIIMIWQDTSRFHNTFVLLGVYFALVGERGRQHQHQHGHDTTYICQVNGYIASEPIALLNGASRWIGRQVALDMAHNYKVVCCSKTTKDLQILVQEITNLGLKAIAIPCDVRYQDQIVAMVNR